MKKYSFLVYHKEYLDFLKGIQNLGVLHIIEKESGEIEDETLAEKYQSFSHLQQAIKFLEKRNISESATQSSEDGMELVSELQNLQAELESNQHRLAHLQKEKTFIEPWGNFNWDTLSKLQDAGYPINFYICPTRSYMPEWEEQYAIERVNEVGSSIYFVVINQEDDVVELNVENIKLPSISLKELNKQIEECENALIASEQIFDKFATNYLGMLRKLRDTLKSELDFSKVVINTEKKADEKLMFLEGWVPDEVETEVIDYLNELGVYHESAKPDIKENPPIKLKNNKFSRLFEPIGELYTLPNYKERDLTPFFAPFYWLFFGFCLGDAGYGLLILILGVILIFRGSEKLKNVFKLVSLLGISTILFGLIGGTFFGISLYELKLGYYGVLAEKFDAQNKTINDHLFSLALILGVIQIIFGMFIKVSNEVKMYSWRQAFGSIGWLIIILGGASTYLLQANGINGFGVNLIKWLTIIVGGSGALLFNNPDRNIFANFGSGLWDAYNMVTGIMGDLLSYIRLFALGISSAILGYVFNSLAVEFAPENIIGKILVMVFILAFGHGINLFMAVLGSFVHPVRLTFVEFYKNAGFMGGGIKYSPFKKNN